MKIYMDINTSFVRFTKVGRAYKPKVSITQSGLIGFNSGAVHKFHINDYKFAILYYSSSENCIGIQLTNNENDEGVCKIRIRTSGADISARAFFEYFDIDHSITNRYDAFLDDKQNMIIVTIKK